MFFRMNVVKNSGSEQIQVDMPSWNPITGQDLGLTPQEMKENVGTILEILDERSADNQLKLLNAYGILRYFPLEYQARLVEVLDILNGKADPAYVVQKWMAQDEENAMLEQGRLAAMQGMANTNGDKQYD